MYKFNVFLFLFVLVGVVQAETINNSRIVGYYSCGSMICNFETPDAGSFDFEIANQKVADKIFKGCKLDHICAINGSFDITNSLILKVTKVEDSGEVHKD